ncbi:DUF4270 family protein [Fluviicola sp.]|jgi:hypothetical protein|uniref:DUF4270 family protein n=1 Tax=Fluviicola sp. TaxID=1917219 RepID=UPI0028330596|nr:DUF4270 family protein [Fluviicola sp.]MDR0803433.1 DUF4270 domain-containing protein [Fluviicola sp.]
MMNLKKLNNNWRKAILLSACFVFTVSVLPSCKKKASTLGTQVLSVDELLKAGGTDTFQLKTYTIDEDSIPTDNQTYGTVGACHDPKFGVMNTSVYTQLSIEGKISLTGTLQQIDSVVLSLPYGGYYGKLTPQTFEVYELDDTLSINSTYYRSNTKPTTGPNLVDPSYATQTPNTTANVLVNNGTSTPDTLGPQLRLRLNNSLGQHFVEDAIAGNVAFNSTSDFLSSNYFKGIKINVANANPGPGSGGVLYFKMGNQECKLTVYFKLTDSNEQKNFSLRLNGSSAYFNHADIDHSGYHVADVLANPANGQTNFYAQCFGLWGAVDIPGLSNLSKKSLINNALLYLPIAYQTGNIYSPSQTITLVYKDNAGYNIVIQGSATTYDDNQKGFVVNLRSYIQDVAAGKLSNKAIYIIPSPNLFSSTADRLIFNGTSTSYKTKPKLVIKYTEFK